MVKLTMPLVSILVPIYNVERYIERCARSVFDQTYKNMEFIFVDDCSPDDSVKILERVAEDYPQWKGRIKILHHDHNRGIAAARNTLVDNCKGEFITHVDSDDWVEPNMVELLMKRQQETDADIVTAMYSKHDVKNEVLQKEDQSQAELTKWGREEMLFAVLEHRLSVSLWRRLIRYSLYRDYGIRNVEGVNQAEDFSVLPKLIYYANNVAWVDQVVYHYTINNPSSYCNNFHTMWDFQRQAINARQLIIEFFKDKELVFQEKLSKGIVKKYMVYLQFTFRNHNRKGYKYVLSLLDETNRDYWYLIDWHRPLKRWLDHHYYLSRMVLPLRKLHGRVYQMFRA